LTLHYALSAGRIKNTARINIDHQTLENKQLKLENEKLKKYLAAAWEQMDIIHKR
jgi:regulator of replication initiation timing